MSHAIVLTPSNPPSASSTMPYHFLTLSPEQNAERRSLLTQRGVYAQYSALAVILLVGIYRHAAKYIGKESPRARGGKKSWLDSPPVSGWSESRKQYLICLAWLFWVLGLAVWKTGDDYLHVTKSVGRVGLAQFPLQVLLSPKFLTGSNNRQILPCILSTSQPLLNPYHRLLGRVVILPLVILHSILYLNFFLVKIDAAGQPLLETRILDPDVQLGLLDLFLVIGLWVTSSTLVLGYGMGGLRKRVSRETFYYTHVGIVLMLLLVTFFHVEYTRPFVYGVSFVWGLDLLLLSRPQTNGDGS